VLCGIVIVIHLPLNWHNDCGRFSFPLNLLASEKSRRWLRLCLTSGVSVTLYRLSCWSSTVPSWRCSSAGSVRAGRHWRRSRKSTRSPKLNMFNLVDFVESGWFLSPECRTFFGLCHQCVLALTRHSRSPRSGRVQPRSFKSPYVTPLLKKVGIDVKNYLNYLQPEYLAYCASIRMRGLGGHNKESVGRDVQYVQRCSLQCRLKTRIYWHWTATSTSRRSPLRCLLIAWRKTKKLVQRVDGFIPLEPVTTALSLHHASAPKNTTQRKCNFSETA